VLDLFISSVEIWPLLTSPSQHAGRRAGTSALLPLAVMAACPINVRFTPKSGHWNSTAKCPLCAKSGRQASTSREAIQHCFCGAEIRSCEPLLKLLEHGSQKLRSFFGVADLCEPVR